MDDPECPDQRDVSPASHVPRSIQPAWKSKILYDMLLMTDNAIEMRRNEGMKHKFDRMRQCFSGFFMYLNQEL